MTLALGSEFGGGTLEPLRLVSCRLFPGRPIQAPQGHLDIALVEGSISTERQSSHVIKRYAKERDISSLSGPVQHQAACRPLETGLARIIKSLDYPFPEMIDNSSLLHPDKRSRIRRL